MKPPEIDFTSFGDVVRKDDLSFTIKIKKSEQTRIMSLLMSCDYVDDIDITSVPLSEVVADMFESGRK